MDNKIETRLKVYQSRKNIEIFFDIIGKLINDLGITKDDTRFCLNVRNENGSNRISVNLNNRLVGGLKNKGNIDYFIFMLYTKDAEIIKSLGIELIQIDKFYNSTNHLESAETFQINIQDFKPVEEKIIPLWLQCCEDFFPTQNKSRYYLHHIPELYKLIVDEEYRRI